jgi:hypothetical protein
MLHISDRKVIFEGRATAGTFGETATGNRRKFIEIQFVDLGFIFARRYLHSDVGCEVFTAHRKSYLFTFASETKRNNFLMSVKKCTEKTERKPDPFLAPFQKACNCCIQTLPASEVLLRTRLTKKWQTHKISTFQYLIYLNLLSGRSFNDLTQYPIFPWVLQEYDSATLDLADPSIYRDFTKPIGALNESRLAALKRHRSQITDIRHNCLYRTHYSNPTVVIGFLIRTEPFSTLHIVLQDGRYDRPGRIFYSIPPAWQSVAGTSNDFRELIPEFFFNSYFLTNENGFDLGTRECGSLSEVRLPRWAQSPHDFVATHRRVFESSHVSAHIHTWIDLIFGVNQRSEETTRYITAFRIQIPFPETQRPR